MAPGPKSLPLILARELASNLSTAMFLLDATGTLVFFNDAAEIIIGKPLRRRDSPAGVAFLELRPAHRVLHVTGYDGTRHLVEATAYPLLGVGDAMHGVVSVFWELDESEHAQ